MNINISYIRDGKEKTVKVTIGELPGSDQEVAVAPKKPVEKLNRLGLKVKNLQKDALEEYNLEGGVQVIQVDDGPARRAGILRGDIIARLNNQSFEDLDAFEEIVKDLPSKRAIPALIIRQGNPSFIVLKMED